MRGIALATVTISQALAGMCLGQSGERISEPGLDNSGYGTCVALSGATLAVSAPFDDGANPESGAIYLYARDRENGTWNQISRVYAPNGAMGDNFGVHDVQMDGDTLIVTASARQAVTGSVYVFARDPATHSWYYQAELTGDGPTEEFGHSAAISGETIVVGSLIVPNGARRGRVQMFVRNCFGQWEEQGRFGGEFDGQSLGAFVGIDGDRATATAAVGNGDGEVRIYVRSPEDCTWSLQQVISSPEPQDNANFGREHWIDGDLLGVAAAINITPSQNGKAWAYRWEPATGTWELSQELTHSGTAFGYWTQVRARCDHIVVTAANNEAYLFEGRGDAFREVCNVFGPAASDFGTGAGLDGHTVVIGAPNDAGTGAVYIFDWPCIEIAGIVPDQGPSLGGNAVTVVGSGFDDSCTVTFGDLSAQVVSQTTTQLTVLVPSRSSPDAVASPGVKVKVTVQSNSCRVVADDQYTYGRR